MLCYLSNPYACKHIDSNYAECNFKLFERNETSGDNNRSSANEYIRRIELEQQLNIIERVHFTLRHEVKCAFSLAHNQISGSRSNIVVWFVSIQDHTLRLSRTHCGINQWRASRYTLKDGDESTTQSPLYVFMSFIF